MVRAVLLGVALLVTSSLAGTEMHGVLVHLGLNMWGRHDHPREVACEGLWWGAPSDEYVRRLAAFGQASDEVRFDEATWREVSEAYRRQGVNTIVLDLGEAVIYPSHPELAVKGSWSVERLKTEKKRLEAMGFEVLPKLNFSTAHDAWLKDYGQMVSTPTYYKVCADLIADVCEVFDRPRLFHLGMDEETADEPCCGLLVARFGNLWWHDLDFFNNEVKKCGSRAWIWVDGIVQKAEKTRAFERLPKDVLLSPWYYGGEFDASSCWELKAMHGLNANGYDMVLCGSSCYGTYDSLELLADYARTHLDSRLVRGYLAAPWLRMEPFFKDRWIASGESLMRAVRSVPCEPKRVRTRVLIDCRLGVDKFRNALDEVRGAVDEAVMTVADAAEGKAVCHVADGLREVGVDVSIRLDASRVTTNDIRSLVSEIRPSGVWIVDDLANGTNTMARAKVLRSLAEAVYDAMPTCEVAVEHGREDRTILNSYVAAEVGIRKNIIACPDGLRTVGVDKDGRSSDVAELIRLYGKPAFVKDWVFAIEADAPSAAFAALALGMDSFRFSLKGKDPVRAFADILNLRLFWDAFVTANRGALPFREYAAQRLALDGCEVAFPVAVWDEKADGLSILPFMNWNGTVRSLAVVNESPVVRKSVMLSVRAGAMPVRSGALHMPGGMQSIDLVATAEGCEITTIP